MAPVFFSAYCYVVLGTAIKRLGERYSVIPSKLVSFGPPSLLFQTPLSTWLAASRTLLLIIEACGTDNPVLHHLHSRRHSFPHPPSRRGWPGSLRRCAQCPHTVCDQHHGGRYHLPARSYGRLHHMRRRLCHACGAQQTIQLSTPPNCSRRAKSG